MENSSKAGYTIWKHSAEFECKYVMGTKKNNSLYQDVISVREKTDPRWPDQTTTVDNYSDLYCMYVNNHPVGCVGATLARNGRIFMEEFCPSVLIDAFRDVIVSAYRFRILAKFQRTSSNVPGVTLSTFIVKEGWRQQLMKGAGIDVINIEKSHVPLYRRMGYLLCEESDYIDPVLGTPSCIMYLPVDPTRKSFIRDMITDEHEVVLAETIQKALTRKVIAVNS